MLHHTFSYKIKEFLMVENLDVHVADKCQREFQSSKSGKDREESGKMRKNKNKENNDIHSSRPLFAPAPECWKGIFSQV